MPILPHLQIIKPELFEAAQRIRTERAAAAAMETHVPMNTRGKSLLSGNIYCGHCGSRLSLTTNGRYYPCAEDPNRVVKRIRYICYGKTRKQTECDGQTGYTAHILDGIVDKVIRHLFDLTRTISKSEVINLRYQEKMRERKNLVDRTRKEYAKATDELNTLKREVVNAIRGESSFSTEMLSSLISEAGARCAELQDQYEAARAAYEEGKEVLEDLNDQFNQIVSWSEMYDSANQETKKMIASYLIKRVDVYRNYKLHIEFNIDFEQFCSGLDVTSTAG